MIRIAHLSDLHFSKITFNPSVFFSKRFIGIINLLINRKKAYTDKHLHELPKLLKSLDVKYVCITGDLTSTSLKKEFQKAKKFIDSFDKDIEIFIIPGNHDQYTKKAYRKDVFYKFFDSGNTHLLKSLKEQKIEAYPLNDSWYYIGLDTCIPTPLLSCSGFFSKNLEAHLLEVLEKIPKDKNILLVNHFPIFHDAPQRKILKRRDALHDILQKYPNIKIYLHGHTHKLNITKEENSPYMICCGCASYKKNATFNILEIDKNTCSIITYTWKDKKWQKTQTQNLVM